MLIDWATLPLEQQVAQLVVVRASGFLFDHQIQYPRWEPPRAILEHWVRNLGVGGVLLLGGSAVEVGWRSRQLQDWAAIPLLIAADIEEGVGQRFAGATWFPPPMALGAIAQSDPQGAVAWATEMGRLTAQEARAIGLNWLLAPVVDVNNNPRNPVINVRAFGETPETVSQLATAFIRGAQAYPVLTTAKHFPGHGDTVTDSHLHLPVLPHGCDRLAQVEFPPFTAAIATGVDAVMTAHLQIPALDAAAPATLSATLLTDYLRQRLGFEGLIVTDALVMGAIAQFGEAEVAIAALAAGADILLMPADPERTIQAVCEAVESGRLPQARIHAALDRLWRAKAKVAIAQTTSNSSQTWEQVSPPPIDPPLNLDAIAQPPAQALADQILLAALRVHRPYPLASLSPDQEGWNLILVDTLVNCAALNGAAPAIAHPASQGYELKLLDSHSICQEIPNRLPPTLLQLFLRGNPFRSTAGLLQQAQVWVKALVEARALQGLVIYGSPYTLEVLVPLLPDTVPWVFSYGQMPQAQAIALAALRNTNSEQPAWIGAGDRPMTAFTD
jgi:beta-glucosidase